MRLFKIRWYWLFLFLLLPLSFSRSSAAQTIDGTVNVLHSNTSNPFPWEGTGWGQHYWFNAVTDLNLYDILIGKKEEINDFTSFNSQVQVIRLRIDMDPQGNAPDTALEFAKEAVKRNPSIVFIGAMVKDPQSLINEVLQEISPDNFVWKGNECGTPPMNCKDYYAEQYALLILNRLITFQNAGITIKYLSRIEPNCAQLAVPAGATLQGCPNSDKGNKIYLTPFMMSKLFAQLHTAILPIFPDIKFVYPTATDTGSSKTYIQKSYENYQYSDFDVISSNDFNLVYHTGWQDLISYAHNTLGLTDRPMICNACGDLSDSLKPDISSAIEMYENFYRLVKQGGSQWNYVFGHRPDDGASGLLGIHYEEENGVEIPVDYTLTKRFHAFRIMAGIVPIGSYLTPINITGVDPSEIKVLAFLTAESKISTGAPLTYQEMDNFSLLIANTTNEPKNIQIQHPFGTKNFKLMRVSSTDDFKTWGKPNQKGSFTVYLPANSITGITTMNNSNKARPVLKI